MKINWKYLASLLLVIGITAVILAYASTSAAANPSDSDGLKFDVSDPVIPVLVGPVRDLPPYKVEPGEVQEVNPRQNPSGQGNEDYHFPGGPDPLLAVQEAAPAPSDRDFDTPIFNFDGAGFQFLNPPDTNGAVGKDHYIQMVNATVVSIYNKDTAALIQQFDLTALGGCSTGSGDPIVLYDHLADRWLLSEFGAGSSLCVFISQTDDPTGSYFSYQFPTPNFPDYPKYGVWPDGYYVSTNEGGSGPAAYALDRAKMVAGLPATSQRFTASNLPGFGFEALTPSDWDGATPPPAGAPNYFMRHRDTEAHGPDGFPTEDFLQIWAFHVDWVTPANSTFTQLPDISVAEFDSDICGLTPFFGIAMPGVAKCAGNSLDPLREVIMFKLQYRNFGSHETLVGNLVTDVTGADDAGVRWFELRKVGAGNWALHQEGTYAPDGDSRWMAAIAMDGSGNIAMGYNVSSGSTFPSLRYAGRLSSDPLGTMPQGEFVLVDGTASNGSNRYGDYSAMSVDPVDDCTFWFTGEYNVSSQWSTRIGAFKFDACGEPDFTLSADPVQQAICTPDDALYDLTIGQVQDYDDPVTLSAAGNPAPSTVDFSTNPVIPPGTSQMTIGNTGGVAFGSYDIDVIGVAPTSTHTITVNLEVFTAVPGAPALVSPPNGATGVSLVPTLTWNLSTQNSTFGLEIATDAGFANVVYSATGIGGTSHDVTSALDPLTEYFWHVRSTNACGNGSFSAAFSFTTADIPPILLVDDDDDNPDVQTAWTDTLDGLGLLYDLWETGPSDDEPALSTLSQYEIVLWFTGDRFGGPPNGPAGPSSTTEAALGDWLDGGGCFFISSQDYRYDKGSMTSFMTNYLGVSNVTDDDGDYTSVTGQNVFAGLGPYPLTFPYTDFTDPMTPGNGGISAMLGNNGKIGGVTKDAGTYKTSWWAFGLETLSSSGQLETLQTLIDWCGVEQPVPPGAFGKISPADGATGVPLDPTLTWAVSAGASDYEYCYDTTDDDSCGNWVSTGGATSANLAGLSAGTTYYWHVRASNLGGTTYSDGSDTAFWSLTTAAIEPETNIYLPVVLKDE